MIKTITALNSELLRELNFFWQSFSLIWIATSGSSAFLWFVFTLSNSSSFFYISPIIYTLCTFFKQSQSLIHISFCARSNRCGNRIANESDSIFTVVWCRRSRSSIFISYFRFPVACIFSTYVGAYSNRLECKRTNKER